MVISLGSPSLFLLKNCCLENISYLTPKNNKENISCKFIHFLKLILFEILNDQYRKDHNFCF